MHVCTQPRWNGFVSGNPDTQVLTRETWEVYTGQDQTSQLTVNAEHGSGTAGGSGVGRFLSVAARKDTRPCVSCFMQ